jgi:hypothetical protein
VHPRARITESGNLALRSPLTRQPEGAVIGLRDAEYAAIRGSSARQPGPPETAGAWVALLKMKLVWRDPLEGGLRLTAAGKRYPAG